MFFWRQKKVVSFDDEVVKVIPSKIQILTLTPELPKDENISSNSLEALPKTYGKVGGIASSALLDVVLRQTGSSSTLSCNELLRQTKQNLETRHRSAQNPMLLSSRKFAVDDPFTLIPPSQGEKYALLISVGYNGILPKSNEAVLTWSEYLIQHLKFSPNHVTILSDNPADKSHNGSSSRNLAWLPPTQGNIQNSLRHIAQTARSGDVVFVQFVGHGSLIKPNSTKPGVLFPCDYNSETYLSSHHNRKITGDHRVITQTDIVRNLIAPLREGVHMTILLDTCHGAGANIIPLPYSYTFTSSTTSTPVPSERAELTREIMFDVIGGAAAFILVGTIVAGGMSATDCCDGSLHCHDLFSCHDASACHCL